MKPIKFDLKLANGNKLAVLNDVENNLTPDLLEHFHSGKLTKWLRVRKLEEQAQAVEALLNDAKENELHIFQKLCAVFDSDIDEDALRQAMQNYQPAEISTSNDDEIEQLKAENEALKAEIETLKNPPKPEGIEIENFIIYENGTVTDTKTGLTWKREMEPNLFTWNRANNRVKKINLNGGFAGYTDWRLPTIEELESLIDKKFYRPKINSKAFPYMPDNPNFWSSSSGYDGYWMCGFLLGGKCEMRKFNELNLMLVRG
jgi:hypothetical protein